MKVCALIPAYNEARHIAAVVQGCLAHCPVVVIDDGSNDDTARLAAEAGAQVRRQPENTGKGNALKVAFEHALAEHYDAVITLDGDGQHDPAQIPTIMSVAQQAPDVTIVVGSRMHDTRDMPFTRVLTNRVMSSIISHLCGQKVLDTQSGYRLISTSVLRAISLSATRYDIETELLLQASAAGFHISEIPIRTIYEDETSDICVPRETWRFLKLVWRHWGT